MSYSNYPRGFPTGITVRGMPLQQVHPGQVFWVHNSSSYTPDGGIAGNDGNPGTYQKPFATVYKALLSCVDGRGDIVLITPGYTETLPARVGATGDGWWVEKASTAIIGLGSGNHRPKITAGNTSSEIEVRAENLTFSNIWFDTDISGQTHVINVAGNECTIQNCLFDGGSATQDANIYIKCNTSQATHIEGNFINCLTAHTGVAMSNTSAEGIQLNAADRAVIVNNRIWGDFTTAAISGITNASLGIFIEGNHIHNIATEDISSGIDLVDACTGMIANNMIFTGNATAGAPTMIDGASTSNMMNWGNEALGEATWPILIGTGAST